MKKVYEIHRRNREVISNELTLYLINFILRRFSRYNLIWPPIVYRFIDAALIGNIFDDVAFNVNKNRRIRAKNT